MLRLNSNHFVNISNVNYFDNIAASSYEILAKDIDYQFNKIVTYINDHVVSSINNYSNNIIQGIEGRDDLFLFNKGDGTLEWKKIDNIPDYFIEFNKIKQRVSNTPNILVTNVKGELACIPNDVLPSNRQSYQLNKSFYIDSFKGILTIDDNGNFITSNIKANNIEENSITGEQIAILDIDNFENDTFYTEIKNSEIQNNNIEDNVITTDKIKDGMIDINKIGVLYNDVNITVDIKKLKNNAIIPEKYIDGMIVTKYKDDDKKYLYEDLWDAKVEKYNDEYYYKILKSEHIVNNSISDKDLVKLNMNNPTSDMFFTDVNNHFQFNHEHYLEDNLELEDFDDEVQEAMRKIIENN